MDHSTTLFLANAACIKAAATAPANMSGTGTMPMASMMQQMSSTMQQNPVEAASLNPTGAAGGMLARWGAKMNMPLASVLNNYKNQMNMSKGRALF
jgi:hypothetical protein